jgi:hydrogenase nickel incorporation protein HypB
LEKTLTMLAPDYSVAALVGDLATENDAARVKRSQVPVSMSQWLDFLCLESEARKSAPQ